MNCLALMCKDLNDMHNDYDISTCCEDSARELLAEAINDFNKGQKIWVAKLVKGFNWWIKYE